MGPGSGAVVRALLARPRGRLLRHLLFALSLVVVVLSIVGMHQLSFGREAGTDAVASAARAKPLDLTTFSEMLAVTPEHAGGHVDARVPPPGTGDACPDCRDHQMTWGSCLLALTLLVLQWLLGPPRPSRVLPFLLPRKVPSLAVLVVSRLIPSLSLAELSLRRT